MNRTGERDVRKEASAKNHNILEQKIIMQNRNIRGNKGGF